MTLASLRRIAAQAALGNLQLLHQTPGRMVTSSAKPLASLQLWLYASTAGASGGSSGSRFATSAAADRVSDPYRHVTWVENPTEAPPSDTAPNIASAPPLARFALLTSSPLSAGSTTGW